MGKVIVLEDTIKNPITAMGKYAGICWNSNIEDNEKNYKRGLDCLESNHGRVMEFAQVYLTLEGYSARTIRQFYTHIGGAPTRLQASTRYIEYGNFPYVIPPSVEKDKDAKDRYEWLMYQISETYKDLISYGIPKEDIAMILPLGMETKIVFRSNLRHLIDMSHQRLCNRTYWEYRNLMKDLMKVLSEYSDEWDFLINNYFKPKCKILGYCPEKNSCGLK